MLVILHAPNDCILLACLPISYQHNNACPELMHRRCIMASLPLCALADLPVPPLNGPLLVMPRFPTCLSDHTCFPTCSALPCCSPLTQNCPCPKSNMSSNLATWLIGYFSKNSVVDLTWQTVQQRVLHSMADTLHKPTW